MAVPVRFVPELEATRQWWLPSTTVKASLDLRLLSVSCSRLPIG